MIEPRAHHGEVSCCKRKKKQKVFIDDAEVAAWKESWHNSTAIMSHPILDRAFEKHVQDYLCLESYDFVKIVDMYILAGSEMEINIETAMRKKVLEVCNMRSHVQFLAPANAAAVRVGKEAFVKAVTERRRDIFNPPKAEVLKILDDNLVQSFLASQQFLDASKN
ncbi:unnamed protein product [Ectocarpus sp. CCAP 1310/34]|nr:unnamed protein product [Ectocarpus sp. CCAP 1310/34]